MREPAAAVASAPEPAMEAAARIAVCICTYRRPRQMARLLDGLDAQTFSRSPRPDVTAIVVENESGGPGRAVCVGRKGRLVYAEQPVPGVPSARNMCLELAAGISDFIVLIDDDETPDRDWLDSLLAAQRDTGADVVAGPFLADFEQTPPAWILRGEFHASPLARTRSHIPLLAFTPPRTGARMQSSDSGNVLFRSDIVRRTAIRFDPSMSRFGYGADTLFFRTVARHGFRIVGIADARVTHVIPPERATLRWLLRRAVQQGICVAIVERRIGTTAAVRLKHIAGAGLRAAFLPLLFPLLIFYPAEYAAWNLIRVLQAVGVLLGSLGVRVRYNRRAP